MIASVGRVCIAKLYWQEAESIEAGTIIARREMTDQQTKTNVRFLVSGDTAVVVEFGDRVERAVSERVLRLSAAVRAANIPGVVETVPTYRSLMILHDPLAIPSAALIAKVRALLHGAGSAPKESRLWRIPACYDEAHAPDLAEIATRTGLSERDVIELHTSAVFHVYMLGFVPGFPYMGDLPASLVLPRRTDPRVKVPAGSIAIAAGQTAIYPVESPGGWHLIGATPVRLFDVRLPQPALLAAGDRVRFTRVTSAEFDDIRAAVERDAYRAPCESASA
jgi:inhibitor of KinA